MSTSSTTEDRPAAAEEPAKRRRVQAAWEALLAAPAVDAMLSRAVARQEELSRLMLAGGMGCRGCGSATAACATHAPDRDDPVARAAFEERHAACCAIAAAVKQAGLPGIDIDVSRALYLGDIADLRDPAQITAAFGDMSVGDKLVAEGVLDPHTVALARAAVPLYQAAVRRLMSVYEAHDDPEDGLLAVEKLVDDARRGLSTLEELIGRVYDAYRDGVHTTYGCSEDDDDEAYIPAAEHATPRAVDGIASVSAEPRHNNTYARVYHSTHASATGIYALPDAAARAAIARLRTAFVWATAFVDEA